MDKTTEILRAAQGYLSNPERWWRGTGVPCSNQQCTVTAIKLYSFDWAEFDAAIQKFAAVNNIKNVIGWNDDLNTTHAELMSAFDKAIGPTTDISVFTALLNPGAAMTAPEVESTEAVA